MRLGVGNLQAESRQNSRKPRSVESKKRAAVRCARGRRNEAISPSVAKTSEAQGMAASPEGELAASHRRRDGLLCVNWRSGRLRRAKPVR